MSTACRFFFLGQVHCTISFLFRVGGWELDILLLQSLSSLATIGLPGTGFKQVVLLTMYISDSHIYKQLLPN